MLRTFFINRADANVFGDIMFRYEKGNPKKFVAPDVKICFGTDKTPRKTHRLRDGNETVAADIVRLRAKK